MPEQIKTSQTGSVWFIEILAGHAASLITEPGTAPIIRSTGRGVRPAVRLDEGEDRTTVYDVITIGETMVAFVPDPGPDRYLAVPVGAESNVAMGLAQLGCRAMWISRLGNDRLGRYVHEVVTLGGVEVSVRWEDHHPTGVVVKEIEDARTTVRYYRSQSAARRLDLEDMADIPPTRWIHVSGITPALSSKASRAIHAVVHGRTVHTGKVSFDVNYRPVLWEGPEAASRMIIPLARAADLVFIGDDEAEVLLGTSDVSDVGDHLLAGDDHEVVLKRGPGAASVITTAGTVTHAALPAEVVDLTGAGDAFASGFLAGTCWGWSSVDRLRLGHVLAARVIGVLWDHAPPLPEHAVETLRSNPAILEDRWRLGRP